MTKLFIKPTAPDFDGVIENRVALNVGRGLLESELAEIDIKIALYLSLGSFIDGVLCCLKTVEVEDGLEQYLLKVSLYIEGVLGELIEGEINAAR
jgi:hypothetical protein